MNDIAPELLEKIQKSFEEQTKELREEIKNGVKSYEEAYNYAIEVGEALANSFGVNITSEILPDGRMYYNIADKVVRPMLEAEYELSSEAAVNAQKSANKASGIGIKARKAEFDSDKAQGIIDRVSSQPYDEIKWILNEPVKTFSKKVVDETIQKNVEFQGRSGLSPKIVRIASSGACKRCRQFAGTYTYPDVPKEVYQRHKNCNCVVEYVESGKKQNVWSKKIYPQSKAEKKKEKSNDPLNAFKPATQSTAVPLARMQSKEWVKSLNASEKQLIQKYTYNQNDSTPKFFERINSFIRNGNVGDKDYTEQVEIISSALKRSILRNDYQCYRGSKYNPFEGMNVGERKKAGQFLSTTLTESKSFEGEYNIIVYATKGTKAAYIERLSAYPKQREMLFDKDVEYEVLYQRGKTIIVRTIP